MCIILSHKCKLHNISFSPQPIAPNPSIPESQAIYDEHIKVKLK